MPLNHSIVPKGKRMRLQEATLFAATLSNRKAILHFVNQSERFFHCYAGIEIRVY